MYIDYEYYQANGGSDQVTPAAFTRLEFRAEKIIDRYTANRIRSMASIPEAVQRLMVELVNIERAQGSVVVEAPVIQSFSNDGYSESYAEPATVERVKEIEGNLILEYLSGEMDDNGVPLLWLGVCE